MGRFTGPPGPHLDLGPFTPQPRAASARRQRTRPQQQPRPARNRTHPFGARRGARLTRYLPAFRRQPDGLRDRGTRPSPGAAPADGLLARRRIAIVRFGTDVAAAGGIGPALAAGLDPAATRSCPQAYLRPGNAPRSIWGYASGTRSCTRRSWPNCTS